jgi:hypothetical protein
MRVQFEDSDEFLDFLESASAEELHEISLEHINCLAEAMCEYCENFFDEGLRLGFRSVVPLMIVLDGKNVSRETLIYLRDNLGCADGDRQFAKNSVLWMSCGDFEFNSEFQPYDVYQAYEFTCSAPSKEILEIVYNEYSHEAIMEFLRYDQKSDQNAVSMESEISDYETSIAAKMKL